MAQSFDIIIIGSGPGGYVAAIKAGQAGKTVAIIEKQHLGGICLNWGCIPTKALLKTAEIYQGMHNAAEFGLKASGLGFDYKKVIERSRSVADANIKGVKFLMKKNKITVIEGNASLVAQGIVKVVDDKGAEEMINGKSIIIATGVSARELPDYPIDGKNFITYRHALEITDFPKRMLVIGSGAIGSEFSYYFNALGTEVHMVEIMDRILPVEDTETSKAILTAFQKQGINCYPKTKVETIKATKGKGINAVLKDSEGKETKLTIDRVLVAVGMTANTAGLDLDKASVKLDEKGFIQTNEFMETSVKGIYAIGDVTGKQLLAHKASAEGEVAVAHILGTAKHGLNYDLIPGCTYCQPQVASIGLTERAAKEKGYSLKIGRFPFQASGKARAIGHTEGFVKLIFDEKYGELLGAHIVGAEATEMIAELGIAMKLETSYEEIMHSVHAHPTLSEAVMEAAMDSRGVAVHI
ncbi:MAG: dihydrolipoyl dehydrogenase [Bacteroidetes bacterium]|nr:dihydrolipoyl dehydrogenase [Bacteroidota bacterium]